MILKLIILISGVLSFGPALDTVSYNRSTIATEYPLPLTYIENYECVVGVPYGYGYLIGKEVYFISDIGEIAGPLGVVDVEQKAHSGQMKERNLVSDILCKNNENKYVHRKGHIAIKSVIY